jgi:hypothetical protein
VAGSQQKHACRWSMTSVRLACSAAPYWPGLRMNKQQRQWRQQPLAGADAE